jgi:predicted nucleic acid-binding protein
VIVYPDSSFLVAHYLSDHHSEEADRRLLSKPTVLITPFHAAELTNAIYQQAFRGRLSIMDAELACADFDFDCATGIWFPAPIPERMYTACVDLARRKVAALGVRTLDTLHVAAALELKADRFWTFDERQARLAEAEGLVTT